MRVQFLTNASCPAGRFGEGATADLDDATVADFLHQGAVKLVGELSADPVAAPSEDELPHVDAPQLQPELTPDPDAPAAPVIQISASDGAQAEAHAG